MTERLEWNGVRKIPSVFDEEQINDIFAQILKSPVYWKGKNGGGKEWGNFFKLRDLCLIASIYILGLRPKEACCLKFKDFNLIHATVKIHGTSNKTGKDRVIPVPSILSKFYKPYLSLPRGRFWRGSEFLFPSLQSSHISPQTLKSVMREKILKPLGMWDLRRESKAQYRTLYKLRHSRATHILNKQIEKHGRPDIHAIANFLGHSDIRSSAVYLHADKEYMEYLRSEVDL